MVMDRVSISLVIFLSESSVNVLLASMNVFAASFTPVALLLIVRYVRSNCNRVLNKV